MVADAAPAAIVHYLSPPLTPKSPEGATMSESRAEVVNAIGMMCPRPIIELAKLSRRVPANSLAQITADDLAFESDVRAWCDTTGNSLLNLERAGDIVTAVIRFDRRK
jgi:cysteine desulfurase